MRSCGGWPNGPLKNRISLVAVVAVFGCSNGDLSPIPNVEPIKSELPDLWLGSRLADVEAVRPALGIRGDGTYWEQARDFDLIYGFWPKAEGEPPPPGSRLMSIEARVPMYDTTGLWMTWRRGVEAAERDLSGEARCTFLREGRATVVRAEVPGPVAVSITAEVWREEDGQQYGAAVATRVYLKEEGTPEDLAIEGLGVGCEERRPW